MNKFPKGLAADEKLQLRIFRIMTEIAELENQLNTGNGIKRFVGSNPAKVKQLRQALAAAHGHIQEAAKYFTKPKPKPMPPQKQITFSLEVKEGAV